MREAHAISEFLDKLRECEAWSNLDYRHEWRRCGNSAGMEYLVSK